MLNNLFASSANYFISLAYDESDSDIKLERLKAVLNSEIDINDFENTYQISEHEFDSLKNHFTEYELTLKKKCIIGFKTNKKSK